MRRLEMSYVRQISVTTNYHVLSKRFKKTTQSVEHENFGGEG